MKKFIILFSAFCILRSVCYAQSISSVELIRQAKEYDGKTVSYAGEVIGDIMRRGEYCWLNTSDGANAIGIWIGKDMVKDIIYTGSYKSIGDEVEVIGVFNRACAEHGGDLDIHAQVLRKINSGRPLQEKLNPAKKNQVIILAGILGLIWILTLLARK
ncbi:MAG: DNA-binding protein [Candidatus Omnitrophica bacterium]|nr:DNA-binding protein [Candidatus Omnitrophota bacterium]